MFQAEAGSGNTASVSSTRTVISDTPATYAISDEQGGRKKVLDNALLDAAGVFFYTPPGICLNPPFESLLSGPTVFGFEIAQEYPPRVPVSRLARRLRYIRRYLRVRSRRKVPGGASGKFINRRKNI